MKATEWKLSISTGLDNYDVIAKNGIDMVELSLGKTKYMDLDIRERVEKAKQFGIKIRSYHLSFHFINPPFLLCDPASLDDMVRERTIKEHSESLRKAADAGIEVGVIHPSGEPYLDKNRPEHIKRAADSFAQLAKVAKECGIQIAIENIPRTCIANCSDEMLQLLAADDSLRVCMDTNHLLIEKNIDFINKIGDKIIAIHASDYDFRNERHWFPGEGSIDWVELVTALENVGFKGPFNYEVGLYDHPALERPRQPVMSDYRRIYEQVINKQPITDVGRPVLERLYEEAFYKEPLI